MTGPRSYWSRMTDTDLGTESEPLTQGRAMHVNEKNFRIGAIAISVGLVLILFGAFALGGHASNNRTERFVSCIETTDRTPLECREAAI